MNGYLGRSKSWSDLKYCMQQKLIFLLKYGSDDNPTIYNDGIVIEWHKEPHAILPLAKPLIDNNSMKVRTILSPEYDEELQDYFNLLKS